MRYFGLLANSQIITEDTENSFKLDNSPIFVCVSVSKERIKEPLLSSKAYLNHSEMTDVVVSGVVRTRRL